MELSARLDVLDDAMPWVPCVMRPTGSLKPETFGAQRVILLEPTSPNPNLAD